MSAGVASRSKSVERDTLKAGVEMDAGEVLGGVDGGASDPESVAMTITPTNTRRPTKPRQPTSHGLFFFGGSGC